MAEATGPAPEALRPPPGNPRFPLFDGLRAGAAIGVLVGHCAGATGIVGGSLLGDAIGNLQMGVTVFFVISGFLLYRPFVAGDMSGRGHPRLAAFYRRRILRIYPAYWFALIAVSFLPGVISVFGPGWWRYFLLIQNYSGFSFTFSRGIGPAWSLSVEVAFYAVLPLAALVLRRLGGTSAGRRMACDLVVLLVVAAASSVVRYLFTSEIVADGFFANQFHVTAILTLPLYATWFAVGMGFASLSSWCSQTGQTPRWLKLLERHPTWLWIGAIAAFVVLSAATPSLVVGEFPAHHLLTGLVAALVVFPAAFPTGGGRGLPARTLSPAPIAWLGLISYGIYLWSTPILQTLVHQGIPGEKQPFLILAPAVFALAVAAGAFSYYVVERPFLRLKEPRSGDRPAAPAPG